MTSFTEWGIFTGAVKRALHLLVTIVFLGGLLILGRTIIPWFPQQLARIDSFSSGFYVDWGVFWGIGAAVGVAALVVLWARENLEF